MRRGRKIRAILSVCLWICYCSHIARGDYCSAEGGGDEYIYQVQVGTINNNATPSSNYADYTAAYSTVMEVGTAYPMTIVTAVKGNPYYGYPGDQCGVWVDWNADGDFYDTGETIYSAEGLGLFTTSITPPAGTSGGNKRMRVRLTYEGSVDPCGSTEYGEVEDYTITIPTSQIKISGYVKTSLGVRIQGINLTASTGETARTDALGYYELSVSQPFTGTVTPAQMDWTFSPASNSYAGISADQIHQDFTSTYTVTYGGGIGTSNNPFQIYNAAQLNAIGANAGDWGMYFRLMNAIDLSGYDGKEGRPTFNRIGYFINNGVDFVPFTGVFDGGSYTISNFTFNSDAGYDSVGLFGYVDGSTAQIKNVKLTQVDIQSNTWIGTGAIIGRMKNGTVSGCSVLAGSVTSSDAEVGGLIGDVNGGSVSKCTAEVTVTGTLWTGGLLGSCSFDSTISDCTAACSVTGNEECGGLIGNIGSDTVQVVRCGTTGTLTMNYEDITNRTAGGVIGSNNGAIECCYSTVDIAGNGAKEIGGLVGRNMGTILNSCARGSVSGAYPTGGLVGVNWNTSSPAGTITNCYSTGASDSAGFIGDNIDGVITASFWDTQTSGTTWSDGGVGKTTEEMKSADTFLDAGWDFNFEDENGNGDYWSIVDHVDYPKLCFELGIKYGGGTGTAEDPFLITTPDQMARIGADKTDWNKYFKLVQDISLAAYPNSAYRIIGTSSTTQYGGEGPFTGTFDGKFHSISGFSYTKTSANGAGLFGFLGTDAVVKNLILVAPNLTDPGLDDMKYVGPIAGSASGANIFGCSVSGGAVQGKDYVGGLIGLAAGTYIASCRSSASVSGVNYIGGLIGTGSTWQSGFAGVADCYAAGNVSGTGYVGGFIGDSSDMILKTCYSTGAVTGSSNVGGFSGYNVNEIITETNVTGCFWDITSSAMPVSAAGTGLETPAMQNQATYLAAGWDFAGELANGGSDEWVMGGYPILWYESPVTPPLPMFAGGTGTAADPFLINSVEQLNSIGHNARLMDKHFKLTRNLDMNTQRFFMIAEKPYIFTGSFDGGNHTVSNLQIHPRFYFSAGGFIGYLKTASAFLKNLTIENPVLIDHWGHGTGALVGFNHSASISNCHAKNVSVEGGFSVGGLVGINYLYASISDSSATGSVSENFIIPILYSAVGGLVGEHSFASQIHNSYAVCSVSGDDTLGGLVGGSLALGSITNSYAAGTVTGTGDSLGGLCGRFLGTNHIDFCYAAARVWGAPESENVGGFIGSMSTSATNLNTACFWDSQINSSLPGIGNASDPEVFAETSANLKIESTYTSHSWDFVNTWAVCEDTNYPRLQCQIQPGDFLCPDGVGPEDVPVFFAAWLTHPADPGWDSRCDLNQDLVVNFEDYCLFTKYWTGSLTPSALYRSWLTQPFNMNWNVRLDLNGDGIINLGDWILLLMTL